MTRIRRVLRRVPFTLTMLAALAIAGLITNTYFQEITREWLARTGFAANDLWYWRLGRLFSSAVVTSGGTVFWQALLLMAVAVGLAEYITGWKRTAATFWGVHVLALILLSIIVSSLAHQLREIGLHATEVARDVGPSAGYFACLGLASARLQRPWQWVTGGIGLVAFVIALFVPATPGESARIKFSADLAHMIAFPLGWLSSAVARRRQSRVRN